MKQVLTIMLAAMVSFFAAAENYFQDGMMWVCHTDYTDATGQAQEIIEKYYLDGEIEYAGKNALRLYYQGGDEDPKMVHVFYVEGDCVYWIVQGEEEWKLLYDFGMEPGDTRTVGIPHYAWYPIVDNYTYMECTSIGKDEAYAGFDVMYMDEYSREDRAYPPASGIWLKGLGSNQGPRHNGYFDAVGAAHTLLEAYLNGEQVYPAQSKVEEVAAETETADPTYYNLQGLPVSNPGPGQILIKNQNGKSAKVIF